MDGEVRVIGKLCTGEFGLMCHCLPVPPNLAKVSLDRILLPAERTVKTNRLAVIFQDVGIGGYMVHTKMYIKYD